MQLTGKVKAIGETQQVSDKFKKRDVIIVDESTQYPQTILFQLTQDRCALADKCSEGQIVTVDFNIRGKEYTNAAGEVKYFNSLEIWKITPNGGKPKETAPQHIPDNPDNQEPPF